MIVPPSADPNAGTAGTDGSSANDTGGAGTTGIVAEPKICKNHAGIVIACLDADIHGGGHAPHSTIDQDTVLFLFLCMMFG